MNEHCEGKVMFSKRNAESFVKGKKMSRITKKKIRIYFHKECGYYHLTTSIDKDEAYNKNEYDTN